MPETYGSAKDLVRALDWASAGRTPRGRNLALPGGANAGDGFERRLEAFLNDPRFLRAYIDHLTVGRITDEEKDAALCVASRSSQTILHNTVTPVVLNTLVDGDSSWLNVSNGRITPDVPGRYDVGCTWNFSGGGFPANSRIIAQIRRNGTYFCGTDLIPIQGTPDGTIRNHKPAQMNGSTDYFDILVYHFQGTGTTARDVVAEMGVWLISRDDSLA